MDKDTEKTRLVRRQDATRLVRKGGDDFAGKVAETDPKTQILSVSASEAKVEATEAGTIGSSISPPQNAEPVVGFLIVLDGPGKGQFRGIFNGMNSVGRGDDQRIPINFGDETISRSEHAYVTYDDEGRVFFVQHGGRANLVRLNGKPVLQNLALKSGDVIRIGKSELKFIPFCGPDFDWKEQAAEE